MFKLCFKMKQAAEEDRVWKDLCFKRWPRVNAARKIDTKTSTRASASTGGKGKGRRGGGRGGGEEGGGEREEEGSNGSFRQAYASLNGWRSPRFRRTILSTSVYGSTAVRVGLIVPPSAGGRYCTVLVGVI